MNSTSTQTLAASELTGSPFAALAPMPMTAPPAVHATAQAYVLATIGSTGFGIDDAATAANARVRDAKQAAPPREVVH